MQNRIRTVTTAEGDVGIIRLVDGCDIPFTAAEYAEFGSPTETIGTVNGLKLGLRQLMSNDRLLGEEFVDKIGSEVLEQYSIQDVMVTCDVLFSYPRPKLVEILRDAVSWHHTINGQPRVELAVKLLKASQEINS